MAATVEQVQADTAAAIHALRERTGVQRVVTVGFCFGGIQSFLAATNAHLGLEAVVGFYGGLDGTRFGIAGPLARVADIRRPVLGLFGGADQSIPPDQVKAFESGLAGTGIAHEIEIYPGAPHSFFDRSFAEHADACEDAWRRVLGFLERVGTPAAS